MAKGKEYWNRLEVFNRTGSWPKGKLSKQFQPKAAPKVEKKAPKEKIVQPTLFDMPEQPHIDRTYTQ